MLKLILSFSIALLTLGCIADAQEIEPETEVQTSIGTFIRGTESDAALPVDTIAAVGLDAGFQKAEAVRGAIEAYKAVCTLPQALDECGQLRREIVLGSIENLRGSKSAIDLIEELNSKSISSHIVATETAFYVAHAALIIGLLCAVFELFRSSRLRKRGIESSQIELEVSLSKLAISGARTGYLVLIGTIALYLAYWRFVYPLQGL